MKKVNVKTSNTNTLYLLEETPLEMEDKGYSKVFQSSKDKFFIFAMGESKAPRLKWDESPFKDKDLEEIAEKLPEALREFKKASKGAKYKDSIKAPEWEHETKEYVLEIRIYPTWDRLDGTPLATPLPRIWVRINEKKIVIPTGITAWEDFE